MRNTTLSLEDAKLFFNTQVTAEDTAEFFKNGFPEILLKNNHFISLLKIKSIKDKAGVLFILNHAREYLPTIIQTHYDFHTFFYSLDKEILSHLFSLAPFIPERFLHPLPAFLKWLQDDRYSIEQRFFLATYFEKHFISLLENKVTLGTLARLLFIFKEQETAHNEWVARVLETIKPKIITLFQNRDLIPYVCVFLDSISANELTFLFQHIPDCFHALLDLPIKPKLLAPLIEFENLRHKMPEISDGSERLNLMSH